MVDKYFHLKENFKSMYLRGASYKDMSKKLGVNNMTLHAWRKRMGLPPRRDRSKKSWKDIPVGKGLSPREILETITTQIGITKNDIEFILTRVDKLKSNGLVRGRSLENVILAATFLYLRWEGSGRRPLSAEQYVMICREFGLTKSALLMDIRLFTEARLYPQKPLLSKELLDRLWKSLQEKFSLPNSAKARILELSNEPKIKYRTPSAVLAACTYVIAMEIGKPISQDELARFFGVTEVTLRNSWALLKKNNRSVRLSNEGM